MPLQILAEAQRFLTESLRGKETPRETIHPWRKTWQFALQHSLRVEALVVQILDRQSPPLSEDEITLLRLAAILHDVGRLDNSPNHGQQGAALSAAWLDARPDLAIYISNRDLLLSLIAHHSEKDIPGPDFAHAVIKDADTLDEIGAISILMCTNWLDRTSPDFLVNLRDRLRTVEIPYCEQKMSILNTPAAKNILLQKQGFIVGFIAQLSDELTAFPVYTPYGAVL